MNKGTHRYDDIIDLPHHVSTAHPQMSLSNRAAQFSPFSALSGYEARISEAARLTDEKPELTDTEKEALDSKLQALREALPSHPVVSVTYFVPDERKNGGSCATAKGTIKKIDSFRRRIVFYADEAARVGAGSPDGISINIDDIVAIDF